MKKFYVSIPINASAVFTVEAESEQQAVAKAYEQGLPNICHQCADDIEIEDWAFDYDPSIEEIDV